MVTKFLRGQVVVGLPIMLSLLSSVFGATIYYFNEQVTTEHRLSVLEEAVNTLKQNSDATLNGINTLLQRR